MGYSGCIGYLIKVAVLNKSYIPLQVRRDTPPGQVKMAAVVLARQDTPPGLAKMAAVVLARQDTSPGLRGNTKQRHVTNSMVS